MIYDHDVDAGRKHEVAKAVLAELWINRIGILSTQVLQEFYVNATRKICTPRAESRLQSAALHACLRCYNIVRTGGGEMPLVKKVTRYGNSSGIILDQPILKQVGWDTGTEVELRVEGEAIILTRHRTAADADVAAAADRVFKRHAKSLERLAR